MRGQAAVEFIHRVDRVAEMFEGVVPPLVVLIWTMPLDADVPVYQPPATDPVGLLFSGLMPHPLLTVDVPEVFS